MPPITALALFALTVSLVLIASGKTVGYDFNAYWAAAHRLASGERLYDPNVSVAGGFAIYLYPPPFALALTPLLLLSHDVALVLWELLLVICVPVGVLLLPVRRDVRWVVILLAALDWPLLYSIKLGQVGPILFLLFAAIWRGMDRPAVAGAAIAAGGLVKVQPGILVVWAAATGRWRTAIYAATIGLVAAGATTLLTGPGAWADYFELLGRVSTGVTAFRNTSPGAIAYLAGLSQPDANLVQWAATAVVVAAFLLSCRIGGSVVSLLAGVVASQLLSPVLWEHYALLLLLPTAWLLERGRAWAILIPLSGWIAVLAFPATEPSGAAATAGASVSWPAAASIPLAFFSCLAVLLIEAYRDRRAVARSTTQAIGPAPGASA